MDYFQMSADRDNASVSPEEKNMPLKGVHAILEELLQTLPLGSAPFHVLVTDQEGILLFRRSVGSAGSFHLPPLGVTLLHPVWGKHALHDALQNEGVCFSTAPGMNDQLPWAQSPHSVALRLRVPTSLLLQLPHWSYMPPEDNADETAQTVIGLALFGDKEHIQQVGAVLLHLMARSFTHSVQSNHTLNTLAEKNKFEQAILRSMPHGFMVIRKDYVVTHANEAAAGLLETTADRLVGDVLTKYIHSELRIREVFRTGKPLVDEEVFIRLASGRTVQVIKNVAAVCDESGHVIAVIDHLREMRAARNLVNRFVGARSAFTFNDIIHRSAIMSEAVELARQTASSPFPLLLQGESGTGKELFAHAVHSAGPRASAPFVVIDCASIPRELVESEFFGYTEGSFTGARRGGRAGKFEQANYGTVFLDELGELPIDIQSRLLRILQNNTVTRVGGVDAIPVDIRIIAATNRNLAEQVKLHNFREDLFYRLNVLSITIPPLRKRQEDIEALAEYFIPKYAKKIGKQPPKISREAMDKLLVHHWPGNARELENAITRAMHLCAGVVLPEHLHLAAAQRPHEFPDGQPQRVYSLASAQANGNREETPVASFQEMEQSLLLDALKRSGGNISKAARLLGVARSTVYKKMRRLGLEIDTAMQ